MPVFAGEYTAQSCVELTRVDLDDHEILKVAQQQRLFKQYIGQCIDGKLLKGIIADVSGAYIEHGYITTKPYLKQQSIADGKLDISVLKGRIEEVVDAKTKAPNARIKTAFAFQKGSILDLRDLETSLEMMNRIPSSSAKFDIKPGHKLGASIVEVQSQDTSPYHLKVGVSGQQELKTKDIFLTADASVDNPLNLNDILTFRYNGNAVQKEFQGSTVGEINYSFPIASYLLELIASRVLYKQGVNGTSGTYLSNGRTDGLRLRINKVLVRNQQNKLNAAVSVYHKSTKNYFASQQLDVSSYRTTLAQLDLVHTYLQSWGQLVTTYSYYQGTDWFGARTDGYISIDPIESNQAKLQFKKHSIDMNLLYGFEDKSYQFTSNVHAQYSNDFLYDNDKLTVGSDYTVRGYLDRSLFGNNAWYVKNDLVKTWAVNVSSGWLQNLSLTAGADYGQVICEADNQSSCGNIYGAAIGLSTQGKYMATNFVWSRPLKKIAQNTMLNNLVKFDVIWNY